MKNLQWRQLTPEQKARFSEMAMAMTNRIIAVLPLDEIASAEREDHVRQVWQCLSETKRASILEHMEATA